MNRPLAIALAALALTLSVSAQQPKVLAPHRPIPKRIMKKVDWSKKATQRSMVGGLWMTDANFKSSIFLRNVVESDPITVTPILWLANGTKFTLPNVTIEPAGTAIIDVNAGLQKNGVSPLGNAEWLRGTPILMAPRANCSSAPASISEGCHTAKTGGATSSACFRFVLGCPCLAAFARRGNTHLGLYGISGASLP